MIKIRLFLLFVGILTMVEGFALPNVLPVDGLRMERTVLERDLAERSVAFSDNRFLMLRESGVDLQKLIFAFDSLSLPNPVKIQALYYPNTKLIAKTDTINHVLPDFQYQKIERNAYLVFTVDSLFSVQYQDRIIEQKTDIRLIFVLSFYCLVLLIVLWCFLKTCTKKSFWNAAKGVMLLGVICFFLYLFWWQGRSYGLIVLLLFAVVAYSALGRENRQYWKRQILACLRKAWQDLKSFVLDMHALYTGFFFRTSNKEQPEEQTPSSENKNNAENHPDCPGILG